VKSPPDSVSWEPKISSWPPPRKCHARLPAEGDRECPRSHYEIDLRRTDASSAPHRSRPIASRSAPANIRKYGGSHEVGAQSISSREIAIGIAWVASLPNRYWGKYSSPPAILSPHGPAQLLVGLQGMKLQAVPKCRVVPSSTPLRRDHLFVEKIATAESRADRRVASAGWEAEPPWGPRHRHTVIKDVRTSC